MKTTRILIAVAAFALPLIGRWLWFNQGIYSPAGEVALPDFAGKTLPQPDLSTPIPLILTTPEQPGSLLVDLTHGNAYDLSELEALLQPLVAAGHPVVPTDANLTLDEQLKSASAMLVVNPLAYYTQSEIDSVTAFVARGGRLVVITDPTRTSYSDPYFIDASISGVDIANQILAPHNLTFKNDYLYNLVSNEGNFRHIIFDQITPHALTEGVNRIVLYSAHSLEETGTALLTGDTVTYSSITDAGSNLPALVLSEDGQVAAIGDMTFLTSPYNLVADNQVLTANLAHYLVGASPTRDLRVYPYLFTRPVTLINAADKALDQDTLELLNIVQNWLAGYGLQVVVAAEPVAGYDVIIPVLMADKDKFQELMAPFGLEFSEMAGTAEPVEAPLIEGTQIPEADDEGGGFLEDESGLTVTIPGIGRVPQDGFGLILFDSVNAGHNSVLLLAASEDGIGDLAGILTGNSLSSCAISGNVAVCPLGSANGVDSQYSLDDLIEEVTPEVEVIVDATPAG